MCGFECAGRERFCYSAKFRISPEDRFLLKLSITLGIPKSELEERLTSRELSEYWAYYTLEPWGEEPADLRTGIIASTIANVFSSGKKQYKPKDFMPQYQAHNRNMTKAQLQAAGKKMIDAFKAMGAVIDNREKKEE